MKKRKRNRHYGNLMTGWDKFSDEEIKKIKKKTGETLKKKYDSGELIAPMLGRKMSPESIAKMKQNPNTGGIRKGAGRGKKGYYKGYICDSTYELAYVIYNLDHNILFKRNTQNFVYTFENKEYKYYPDFVLQDGTFIEIKGFYDEKSKAKIKQFPLNIKLITGDEILSYIKYVKDKYDVKKLTDLYEDKIIQIKIDKNKKLIEQRKEIIRNSGIDFSLYGWVSKVKKLLQTSKASKFILQHMKEELNPYFSHR